MSSIIIRFCAANDLIATVIRAGCYGHEFSHVEIVLPNGDAVAAHASSGVTLQPANVIPKHTTHRLCYDLPCTDSEAASIYAFLEEQVGKPYDLKAIAAIAASFVVGPRDWACSGKWFCSELCAAALVHAGILGPKLKDFRRVTPRDLELIILARAGITTMPLETFA